MKLATLKDGSRDGQLLVVSRDLSSAHVAQGIAPTLQRALDDWAFVSPQLADLYARRGTRSPSSRSAARHRCRAPASGPTDRPT